MVALEEGFLEPFVIKHFLCWRSVDDVFMIWYRSEDRLKEFIDKLNNFFHTIN